MNIHPTPPPPLLLRATHLLPENRIVNVAINALSFAAGTALSFYSPFSPLITNVVLLSPIAYVAYWNAESCITHIRQLNIKKVMFAAMTVLSFASGVSFGGSLINTATVTACYQTAFDENDTNIAIGCVKQTASFAAFLMPVTIELTSTCLFLFWKVFNPDKLTAKVQEQGPTALFTEKSYRELFYKNHIDRFYPDDRSYYLKAALEKTPQKEFFSNRYYAYCEGPEQYEYVKNALKSMSKAELGTFLNQHGVASSIKLTRLAKEAELAPKFEEQTALLEAKAAAIITFCETIDKAKYTDKYRNRQDALTIISLLERLESPKKQALQEAFDSHLKQVKVFEDDEDDVDETPSVEALCLTEAICREILKELHVASENSCLETLQKLLEKNNLGTKGKLPKGITWENRKERLVQLLKPRPSIAYIARRALHEGLIWTARYHVAKRHPHITFSAALIGLFFPFKSGNQELVDTLLEHLFGTATKLHHHARSLFFNLVANSSPLYAGTYAGKQVSTFVCRKLFGA